MVLINSGILLFQNQLVIYARGFKKRSSHIEWCQIIAPPSVLPRNSLVFTTRNVLCLYVYNYVYQTFNAPVCYKLFSMILFIFCKVHGHCGVCVCVCRYTVSVHLQSKASGIMLNTVLHSFSWSILEIFPCHLMEFLCFFQWLGSIPYFIDVPQSSQSPLRSHLNCFRILAQCCRVHPCTCDCSVSGSYRVLTRKLLVHQVCAHFNMCCQIVFQKVAPVLH